MLTKKFKSNKFYEVTRYFFKYGHDYDEIDGNTTVWDSLEKAKAFIEKYRFNRKFYSATVEEIIVDRVISAEDYKKNNYEVVSYQEVYSEDYDGNYDETHQSFSSWARVGDIVDEQIVEEFRDCIFPVAYDAMYLQCGEPYTHEINPKTGKWEPAFITFARKLGSWVYKGICFYREYEDVG